MTLAFEAARRKVAGLLGGDEGEIVFTRGATEAINLVATWGAGQSQGRRPHPAVHAGAPFNIVPWQLLRERTGVEIDVCPLTPDGRIDLEAAERMLTPAHKLVASRMCRTCSARCFPWNGGGLAHAVGAKILIDGCQAVPRLAVDVKALGCDFYVCSAHKLYGPTGIGALWARADILDAMPRGRAAAR
jgi:cysteine desulfurase/selenocysteine lyase